MNAPLDSLLGDAAALRAMRCVVVVAHPDDEVLGCGALLPRLGSVAIVHATDGAPRDGKDAAHLGCTDIAYAALRRREAEAALAIAGHGAACLTGLAIHDQEASLHLTELARALVPILRKCDLVFTHAYEGGHSDHDAVAFAVQAALRLGGVPRPVLVEMPYYHADAAGWVRQVFLPQAGAGPALTVALDRSAQDLKARMIAAHASQAETLRSFSLAAERFRLAPVHDFRALPHAGPLLYERHGWNLTGPQWLARVRDAEAALGFDTA